MNFFDHAQRGLQILMREGYEKAKAAGQLDLQPDGSELFTVQLPEPVSVAIEGVRRPDGFFAITAKSIHQTLGGDDAIPWEHFEHQVAELLKRPPAQGFGRELG